MTLNMVIYSQVIMSLIQILAYNQIVLPSHLLKITYLHRKLKQMVLIRKKNKERLPFVATAEEWRSWYKLKSQQREEQERKKVIQRMQKQNNIKIKLGIQEELNKIKPQKIRVQAQLKELESTLQQNKKQKKSLQLQFKSEITEEKRVTLDHDIKNIVTDRYLIYI